MDAGFPKTEMALLRFIAGRQKNDNVTVNGIPFQIALQGFPVNLDMLHSNGLRALHG